MYGLFRKQQGAHVARAARHGGGRGLFSSHRGEAPVPWMWLMGIWACGSLQTQACIASTKQGSTKILPKTLGYFCPCLLSPPGPHRLWNYTPSRAQPLPGVPFGQHFREASDPGVHRTCIVALQHTSPQVLHPILTSLEVGIIIIPI